MAAMTESFFVQVGEGTFTATDFTRGPWDANAQHAGPPAALLGWAIEHRAGSRVDMRIARITFDILKPVPISTLTITTRIVHAGRSIEVVEATMSLAPGNTDPRVKAAVRPGADPAADPGAADPGGADPGAADPGAADPGAADPGAADPGGADPGGADPGGAVLMRASAVRIRESVEPMPSTETRASFADPSRIEATLTPFPFDTGYHTAMETRYAVGSFDRPGPASVWFRMRHALVAGAPIDPLSRVLIAADSGNGVSSVFNPREVAFVNPEMTVHLHRYPAGDWVLLDAASTLDPAGIGLADTALHDATGPIGRGTQSLYVARRT